MYNYGLIGNCQCAALVDNQGSVDWLCLPRPDSPPVFGRLLDPEGGYFTIETAAPATSNQRYISNTNVLVTTLKIGKESEIEITDFCPRFTKDSRIYRPPSMFRMVRPIKGAPTITIKCRPVNGWSKTPVKPKLLDGALQFIFDQNYMRLDTNMPLAFLTGEKPFSLSEPLYFGLNWGAPMEGSVAETAKHFLDETLKYWRDWVMQCNIPTLYQKESIRSALALKLHCYEDTGAILAALTTSLPEEIGKARNWDYRFCWLRDSFFVLSAFYNLGHFSELEKFLKYFLNIAYHQEYSRDRLRPVYTLDQSLPLPEHVHNNWAGYKSTAPVRTNNQAAEHVQNDVYGEMILTLSSIFFDERFEHWRTPELEKLLAHLVNFCIANIGASDASLWEFRNDLRQHSFSALMDWVGIQKIIQVQERGYLRDLKTDLHAASLKAEETLTMASVDGYLRSGSNDNSVDASLLLLPVLGYPDSALCRRTVLAIERQLQGGEDKFSKNFLFRYLHKDDFDRPNSTFVICSFWLVEALAKIGHTKRARSIMKQVLKSSNHVGLFSEHFLPGTMQQLGNFPQAYSHVGLINAAFAVSPSWATHFTKTKKKPS